MTAQRITQKARMIDLRSEMNSASSATRIVITDVHLVGDVQEFELSVDEIVSPNEYARQCEECGAPFTSETSKGVYCGTTCRVRAHRKRQAQLAQETIDAVNETAP